MAAELRSTHTQTQAGVWQNIYQFFRCALLGSWSPLIGQSEDMGSLVTAVVSGIALLVLLLFWAWS